MAIALGAFLGLIIFFVGWYLWIDRRRDARRLRESASVPELDEADADRDEGDSGGHHE